MIDDATLRGKARTVYYDIHNKEKDSTSGAWTAALWLDLRSGYLNNIVGFGMSYYGVTRLNMPDSNRNNSQLLDRRNKGLGKLGQAFVELKLPASEAGPAVSFTAGRLTHRTGLLSGSTSRSLPSSWSGYNLAGKYQNLTFGFACAGQTSLRNDNRFHNITNFSGEKIRHIIASEIGYTFTLPGDKTLHLHYRNAVADRFLQAHNLDSRLTTPVFSDTTTSFGVSYFHTQKDGNLWQGTGFGGKSLFDHNASVVNLNAGLHTGYWHFQMGVSRYQAKSRRVKKGYTKPGEYYYDLGRNTHGTWNINTNGFAENMMYDGETSWMAGASYDFSGTALTGLELGYAFHYGSGMKVIDPHRKKHSASEREHDILLLYAFPQPVLKGLKFKMKYGLYRNNTMLRKAINKQENDLRVWLDYDVALI